MASLSYGNLYLLHLKVRPNTNLQLGVFAMTELPPLETERLLLRRWKEEDLEPFARLNQDAEVMRYFPKTLDVAQTEELYEKIQAEFDECGYGLYAVEDKQSGSFMGFTGFHRASLEVGFCPCIEIGWRLDKPYWNKGYATEAAKACLKYGFDVLGFDRVYSFTAIENKPSQRVMQKIGLTVERYFDHPEIPEGHILRPHVCYWITV